MTGAAVRRATRAVFFDVDFTLIYPGPTFRVALRPGPGMPARRPGDTVAPRAALPAVGWAPSTACTSARSRRSRNAAGSSRSRSPSGATPTPRMSSHRRSSIVSIKRGGILLGAFDDGGDHARVRLLDPGIQGRTSDAVVAHAGCDAGDARRRPRRAPEARAAPGRARRWGSISSSGPTIHCRPPTPT